MPAQTIAANSIKDWENSSKKEARSKEINVQA
jgi:hypothetical protein